MSVAVIATLTVIDSRNAVGGDQPFYSDQPNFIPDIDNDSDLSDSVLSEIVLSDIGSCCGICTDDESWFEARDHGQVACYGFLHSRDLTIHRRACLEHDGQILWGRQPALVACGSWKTLLVFWNLMVACCNHGKTNSYTLLHNKNHIFFIAHLR